MPIACIPFLYLQIGWSRCSSNKIHGSIFLPATIAVRWLFTPMPKAGSGMFFPIWTGPRWKLFSLCTGWESNRQNKISRWQMFHPEILFEQGNDVPRFWESTLSADCMRHRNPWVIPGFFHEEKCRRFCTVCQPSVSGPAGPLKICFRMVF